MRSFALLLLALVACTPAPKPPVSGGNGTVDTTRLDTTVVDTGVADSVVWPKDYTPDTTELKSSDLRSMTAGLVASYAVYSIASMPTFTGLMFGMSGYKPTSRWCASTSVLNGSNMTIDPGTLASALAVADKCGYHFAPAMARKLMTTNGVWNGPYSLSKFKQAVDKYYAALAPEKWRYYVERGVVPYLYTMDDMGCTQCWGGTAISQQTTAEAMKYAKAKFAAVGVPIALRVHPQWMLRNGMTRASWAMPNGASSVDLNISQYYEIFSSQKPFPTQEGWYQAQRVAQAALGIPKQSFTVAYGGCWKAATGDGCPADKLKRFGLAANATAGNCANIGWNWRPEFDRDPWLSAIKAIAADASGRTTVTCRPGAPTALMAPPAAETITTVVESPTIPKVRGRGHQKS